jgi:hypothetical protein
MLANGAPLSVRIRFGTPNHVSGPFCKASPRFAQNESP